MNAAIRCISLRRQALAYIPIWTELILNIDGELDRCMTNLAPYRASHRYVCSSYARASAGKRHNGFATGRWEVLCFHPSSFKLPRGFSKEIIGEFEQTGRKVLCDKPYSGTEVRKDYGKEMVDTGALIVYTSADSVFQIAAREDVVPVETL